MKVKKKCTNDLYLPDEAKIIPLKYHKFKQPAHSHTHTFQQMGLLGNVNDFILNLHPRAIKNPFTNEAKETNFYMQPKYCNALSTI